MKKSEKKEKVEISIWLPVDAVDGFRRIAKYADSDVETVLRVLLAVELLRSSRTAGASDVER